MRGLVVASGAAPRAGIFTATTVMWLMIAQRLSPDRTLALAVENLRRKRETELLKAEQGSCRVRAHRISPGTGGYAQARKRLPLAVVEEVADKLTESVLLLERKQKKEAQELFIIDGSTVQVCHTADNLQTYPQHENQHGQAHYPLVRICLATHADTGVITRPSFGPYSGTDAVSEIALADAVLSRLPRGATVVGDRMFGCFRFIYAAQSNGLDVICRLKKTNAESVAGKLRGESGELQVRWCPSKREVQKYPGLATAGVVGRLIWCPLVAKGKERETLVLFTTTNRSPQEVVTSYGKRWYVETDLRDIKSTLKMNFIDAKSPEMIAKEIILGCCAYNLIRLAIGQAAIAAKLKARKFSFANAMRRIHSVAYSVFARDSEDWTNQVLLNTLCDMRGLILPTRAGPRSSEPRKAWPRGARPLMTKTRDEERKLAPKRKKPLLR